MAVVVLRVLLHGVRVVLDGIGLYWARRREREEPLVRLFILARRLVRSSSLFELVRRAAFGGGLCDGL